MLGKHGVVDGLQFRQCKQHVRGESRTRLVTGICLQVLQQFGELWITPEDFDLPGNIRKTKLDRLVAGAVFDHFVNPLADDARAWTSNGALHVVSAKFSRFRSHLRRYVACDDGGSVALQRQFADMLELHNIGDLVNKVMRNQSLTTPGLGAQAR